MVASCEGQVDALRVFDGHWRHADNRHGSPYYFLGILKSTNVPVFIKIWRDGDERTSRREVEEEIRLLKGRDARFPSFFRMVIVQNN